MQVCVDWLVMCTVGLHPHVTLYPVGMLDVPIFQAAVAQFMELESDGQGTFDSLTVAEVWYPACVYSQPECYWCSASESNRLTRITHSGRSWLRWLRT